MKLTVEWLNKKYACSGGIEWFKNCGETNHKKVLEKLISEQKYDWANWLIVRYMTYKQYVSYSVYAAEQVIDLFEKKHPNDKRPRQAINAAKRCIKNPSSKNKAAARAAAWAARAAAWAAWAAGAAWAAEAARAARAAAWAAWAAGAAWAAEAAWAARAARAAGAALQLKILQYGMKLLKGEN